MEPFRTKGSDDYLVRQSGKDSAAPFIYRITATNNLFLDTDATGTLNLPAVQDSTVNEVSFTQDVLLRKYENTAEGTELLNGPVLMDNTGNGIKTVDTDAEISYGFGAKTTYATKVTARGSNALTWNGGFIHGTAVNADTFVPESATLSGNLLSRYDLYKIWHL